MLHIEYAHFLNSSGSKSVSPLDCSFLFSFAKTIIYSKGVGKDGQEGEP